MGIASRRPLTDIRQLAAAPALKFADFRCDKCWTRLLVTKCFQFTGRRQIDCVKSARRRAQRAEKARIGAISGIRPPPLRVRKASDLAFPVGKASPNLEYKKLRHSAQRTGPMNKRTFTVSIFGALSVLSGALLTGPAVAQSGMEAFRLCKTSQDPEDKIRFCSIAIRQNSDRRVLERSYLRRGNSFMELKRYQDAVGDYTKLIDFNSTIAGYFDDRLAALSALGLKEQALADADKEISLAPDKAFVYRSRGFVLEDLQRYDAALHDFDRAVDIDPKNNGLIVDRARIKAKAGHPLEAISDLSRVISVEPSNLAAYKERGMIYAAMGNFGAAESDLQFYAKAVPSDQEVLRALEALTASKSVGESPAP